MKKRYSVSTTLKGYHVLPHLSSQKIPPTQYSHAYILYYLLLYIYYIIIYYIPTVYNNIYPYTSYRNRYQDLEIFYSVFTTFW